MSFASAARSYRNVGLESRIADPDPHQLVLMLFDGAIEKIRLARAAIQSRDVASKVAAITGALNIVQCLRRSLNDDAGELAARLGEIYDYAGHRLLHANVRGDAAALTEVQELLVTLRSGWAGIAPKA